MPQKTPSKHTKKTNTIRLSFGFFMIVGPLLSWSLVSAIISTTEFQNDYWTNMLRVFIVVGFFTVMFSHRYLRIASALLFTLFAFFIFSGFNSLRGEYSFQEFFSYGLPILPNDPSLATRFAHLLSMTFRYIIGIERHTLLFENTTIWIIIATISLLIVIFCYYQFYFWALLVGTAVAFGILISSPYFSHPWSFNVYIFCILTLLAKRLHQRSIDSSTKGTSPFSGFIMPLVALCLMPALLIPAPQTGFTDDGALSRSFNTINDMFYNLTRQRSFSLQQVGFSGEGGRLGGAVTLNHNLFMRIRIDEGNPYYPMPIYITGATFDTYTGYSWENEHAEFVPVDFSTTYHNMELFEQATEIGTVESTWIYEFINNIALRDGFESYVLVDEEYFTITSEESLEMYYTQMSGAIQSEHMAGRIDAEELVTLYSQLQAAIESMAQQLEATGEVYGFPLALRDIMGYTTVTSPSRVMDRNYHLLVRGVQHGGLTMIEMTEDGDIIRLGFYAEPHGGGTNEVTWHGTTTYTSLEIDVLNTRPTSIFHTGIVRDAYAQNAEVAFLRDRDGRFSGASQLPRQTRYTILYSTHNDLTSFYFNFDRDVLLETSSPRPVFSYPGILRDNLRPFDVVNAQLGRDFLNVTLVVNGLEVCVEELLSDYLIPRAERIHETYTVLPDDFPARVAQLAQTVTADATNNYERMRMLEEYLSSNYSYTLSTVTPPRDMDFVEHFLFETKQGYCVYFATAFVAMARSLNVPTRYVEGFLVRGTPNDNGFIDVFNSMAHAWPEVYFEGSGWLRFEPTPRTGLPQFRPTPEGGGIQNNNIPDWASEFDNMNNGVPTTPAPPANEGTPAGDNGDTGANAEAFRLPTWIIILFAIGLAIILLLARIVFIQGKMLPRRRWHPAAAKHFFRMVLSYLKHFNLEIEENETVFQFADRVCKDSHLITVSNIDLDLQNLKDATQVFAKARYSREEISKKEVILVRKVSRSLEDRLKSKMGIWKYLLYRYIIGFR